MFYGERILNKGELIMKMLIIGLCFNNKYLDITRGSIFLFDNFNTGIQTKLFLEWLTNA